jgi:hypothetical protein
MALMCCLSIAIGRPRCFHKGYKTEALEMCLSLSKCRALATAAFRVSSHNSRFLVLMDLQFSKQLVSLTSTASGLKYVQCRRKICLQCRLLLTLASFASCMFILNCCRTCSFNVDSFPCCKCTNSSPDFRRISRTTLRSAYCCYSAYPAS